MFTSEQLAKRREFIGASEAAAVLGLSPYRTALDVYTAKVLGEESKETRFTRWGHRLEAVVADAYAEETGREIIADQVTRLHPVYPCIGATPDFRVPGGLLEVKTGDKATADRWGEPGTDQVPEHVACQVVVQMAVCDVDRGDVAVLLGGNDLRVYTIQRDRVLEASLLEQLVAWWQSHVVTRQAPSPTSGEDALRFVARMFPRSESDIVRPASEEEAADLIELLHLKGDVKELEGEIALLEAKLKSAIGTGGGISSAEGSVTWKSTKSGGTDWKAVAEALNAPADLIARHQRPGSRRFLVGPSKLAKLVAA